MCCVNDGLVGELLQYGGSGIVYLLERLCKVVWQEVVWQEEPVPREWREGLIVIGRIQGITGA